MSCERIRPQLTAYLDGELEGDRGTAVRGHLRTCDACRQVATDEAALRDGLRALPALDPPPSLWAGVQAQLAAEEVEVSKQPAWRRAVSRWMPMAPRFGLAFGAVALAALLLVWRSHRHAEPAPEPIAQQPITPVPAPAAAPAVASDVSTELAAAPARVSGDYAKAAAELLAAAQTERAQWAADQQQAFDDNVAALQKAIDGAAEGRPRQKAYRALIHYLQGAAIRDEVALQ
jgi:predicted anti-sigma-YlaC factor YlaD